MADIKKVVVSMINDINDEWAVERFKVQKDPLGGYYIGINIMPLHDADKKSKK